jgi:DNA-binding NarL/FixJ family response regulator
MNPVVRLAGSAEYFLHPLLSYVLMAVGLGLCLYLFMTLKVEIRRLLPGRIEDQQRVEALENALAEARLAVQQLENDLREVERQTGMLVAPAPARSGLNLSKRTQVLRLHRSGEGSAAIATSLGLPRGEVDLLIKVHGMVLEQI